MNPTQTILDLGRAKNSAQDYLVRKLLFPKIYLDTDLDGVKIDVLGIDRGGAGDVHGVRLVPWEPGHRDNRGYSSFLEKTVSAAIDEFNRFEGHFRYLTIVNSEPNKMRWIPSKAITNQSLASDGVGRVGLLYADMSDKEATIEVLLKPERFRSSKEIVELADRYVAEHTPNWEVRD
jgi:hypothetical protein